MKKQLRTLKLSREVVRVLVGAEIRWARGGMEPDPLTAATDGNNGCPSEAGGCHTGYTACGTC